MTFGRALRWSILIFGIPTAVATGTWSATGDWSFDIGVTFALIPTLVIGLYLGYRLVKAGIGELMPFVVGVVAVVPAVILGWCGFQALRLDLGKRIGPIPVEKYATMTDRNAVVTRLRGRMLWTQGANFKVERGGSDVRYTMLPFVPVSWKKGDPVPVWVLGTKHRYKRHDFDDCPYDQAKPISDPCTISLNEPHLRELRLRLIRLGHVPKVGGMNFVVLRADVDRLWLPRRLTLWIAPLWFLLLTLWIRRMGRTSEARRQRREA